MVSYIDNKMTQKLHLLKNAQHLIIKWGANLAEMVVRTL